MPKVLDIKNSFVTGEISPLLLGRTDLTKYPSACESVKNFIIRVEGGLSRRPGLLYITDAPVNSPGRLIPFIFNSVDSFVLLILGLKMYFFKDAAIILDSNTGNPYAIDVPWGYADNLEDLKFCQILDTMYFVHPKFAVRKLNRLADDNWVLIAPKFHAAPATQQDEDVSRDVVDISGFGDVIPAIGIIIRAETFADQGFKVYDIGHHINAGTGQATISALHNPATFGFATADIVVDIPFDQTNYSPGDWSIDTPGHTRAPAAPLRLVGSQPGIEGDHSVTFDGPVIMDGDIGKQIVAGTGIAVIVSRGGPAVIGSNGGSFYSACNVMIIDDFDQISYIANTWFLRGGPSSYFCCGVLDGNKWHGSDKFGIGSVVPVRTFDSHPTDNSFQESTGTAYVNVTFSGSPMDTFRLTDVGRYVAFSGGYGQIVAVQNSTTATLLILSVPKQTESDAHGNLLIAPAFPGAWFFEDQAFTAANGFPKAVCFFQDRLWFGGTDSDPQTTWGSQTDDFENFAKGTLDDDGIEIQVASGDLDTILWMQPYLGNIVLGTFRGEHILSGGGGVSLGQNSQAITPTNASITYQSAYGVAPVQPDIIQQSLIFIQRSLLNVYQMEFNIQSASYDSKDLTVLNNFIVNTGIIEMAFQQNQTKIIWFIAADEADSKKGKYLIGLSFDKGEGVFAWHRHFSGKDGKDSFVSMAVIPNVIDGVVFDQMYVMMERKIGDAFQYTIEVFDPALNVDCADRKKNNITPFDSMTGLGRLMDAEVVCVADGALLPTVTMDGSGVYTFPPTFKAKDAQIGMNYISEAITVRPEIRGLGTSQGLIKRWNKVWIRVYQSLGLFVNNQFIPNRTPSDDLGKAVPLFTGDESIVNLGYDRDGRIVIQQPHPLPAEVLAMFGQLLIGEV